MECSDRMDDLDLLPDLGLLTSDHCSLGTPGPNDPPAGEYANCNRVVDMLRHIKLVNLLKLAKLVKLANPPQTSKNPSETSKTPETCKIPEISCLNVINYAVKFCVILQIWTALHSTI